MAVVQGSMFAGRPDGQGIGGTEWYDLAYNNILIIQLYSNVLF